MKAKEPKEPKNADMCPQTNEQGNFSKESDTNADKTHTSSSLKDSFVRYINRKIKSFEKILIRFCDCLHTLESSVNLQQKDLTRCVNIVRQCQQQTAELINHDLERHALNPAIETVVVLADEIIRADIGKKLTQKFEPDIALDLLHERLQSSAEIAKDKLAYLDIQKINPAPNDTVEPDKHNVCAAIETDNKNRHGKISSVLSEGIIYRGKVLKQAKVSAYRCTEVNC